MGYIYGQVSSSIELEIKFAMRPCIVRTTILSVYLRKLPAIVAAPTVNLTAFPGRENWWQYWRSEHEANP